MNCVYDMNSTMKRDLHRDYAALCNATTVPSSSEFLFGDLSKLTKDILEANKLTKKVRPASHSSSHGRKSKFTSHYSANRNRRFAHYAYPRARYNDNFFIQKPLSANERKKGEHNQVIKEPQNNKPLNKVSLNNCCLSNSAYDKVKRIIENQTVFRSGQLTSAVHSWYEITNDPTIIQFVKGVFLKFTPNCELSKVCIRAKWLIRLELIPVSLA